MTVRHAACACGQLKIAAEGEPVRISICHCRQCQRRTGSPFGFSAHYPREQITSIEGRSSTFTRTGDSGNSATFHFCPVCGSSVYWEPGGHPERITIAVGTFADPTHPSPRHSVYEEFKHPWVVVPDGVERMD
jgi:hypothetical protein